MNRSTERTWMFRQQQVLQPCYRCSFPKGCQETQPMIFHIQGRWSFFLLHFAVKSQQTYGDPVGGLPLPATALWSWSSLTVSHSSTNLGCPWMAFDIWQGQASVGYPGQHIPLSSVSFPSIKGFMEWCQILIWCPIIEWCLILTHDYWSTFNPVWPPLTGRSIFQFYCVLSFS